LLGRNPATTVQLIWVVSELSPSYSIIVGVWAMSSSQWENLLDIQPIPVVNK